jgi:hypothetical protein
LLPLLTVVVGVSDETVVLLGKLKKMYRVDWLSHFNMALQSFTEFHF